MNKNFLVMSFSSAILQSVQNSSKYTDMFDLSTQKTTNIDVKPEFVHYTRKSEQAKSNNVLKYQ